MTEDHEAAEVAKGLSKEAIYAVRNSQKMVSGKVRVAYRTSPNVWEELETSNVTLPRRSGLPSSYLSPLGLRVRAHLQGETE